MQNIETKAAAYEDCDLSNESFYTILDDDTEPQNSYI